MFPKVLLIRAIGNVATRYHCRNEAALSRSTITKSYQGCLDQCCTWRLGPAGALLPSPVRGHKCIRIMEIDFLIDV